VGDRRVPRAEDGLAPDRAVTTEWGDPTGRPLVFWPGLNPWGALQLVEVGPLLAERGFHVVAITPPGTTGTPRLPDDYRPTRLAELVLATADAHGVERFAFMGHSWGASIGVHLAADHADRVDALVLLDAGHTDVDEVDSLDELVAQFEADQAQFGFESWDAYFDWVRGRVRDWRETLEPRYRAGMTERDGRIVAAASARAAAWAIYGISREQPSSGHSRLTVRTLLIRAASNDDAEALERFRAAVPHAQVETLDTGHDVPEDAPADTVRCVAAFLESALP